MTHEPNGKGRCSNFDAKSQQSHFAPPAQVLYRVSTEGVKDFRPIPVKGAMPWKCLPGVNSAPLGAWIVQRGDIVSVDLAQRGQDYAKVSDLRLLRDGRYIAVYAWLYARWEIAQELQVDGRMPIKSPSHLDKMWPPNAEHKYMLSTNRTITLWDTAIERAPTTIATKLCQDAIYSTTSNSRRIVKADIPRFEWMRKILFMSPQPQQALQI
ncbi:uncharacterized protein PFLUO_LOCUS1430 [Penicillium psychrofluorescens]|uniref:uncharacterized protein n=1 Tax=Penicillium psychrofluorescens TaxID=3158075 RepID=UPI003CCDEEF4